MGPRPSKIPQIKLFTTHTRPDPHVCAPIYTPRLNHECRYWCARWPRHALPAVNRFIFSRPITTSTGNIQMSVNQPLTASTLSYGRKSATLCRRRGGRVTTVCASLNRDRSMKYRYHPRGEFDWRPIERNFLASKRDVHMYIHVHYQNRPCARLPWAGPSGAWRRCSLPPNAPHGCVW